MPDPNIETLIDLFSAAVVSEKRDLLREKRAGVWQDISARTLAEKVRATAMGLYALGVRAGDHVGLLSENRSEWTIADLGVLHCGAADVPIYADRGPSGGFARCSFTTRATLTRTRKTSRWPWPGNFAGSSLRRILCR